MTARTLWQVSIATSPEAEEAVAELLQTRFGKPASVYTDAETGAVRASLFLELKPSWSGVKRQLRGDLARLAAYGLPTGPGIVTLKRIPRQNWAESWKKHFKPIQIGSRLIIKPSWSKGRPRKGQALVILDPGLSFGTGHHPTTSFCLRQLAVRRHRTEAQSLLDLGTGSGILAIAAARLGYGPVEALDFDAEAIRVAQANARKNRLAGKIRFKHADLAKLPATSKNRFSVVCANLITPLLLQYRDKIIARLSPGGVLLLAGILKSEFAKVRRLYEKAGLRFVASRTEKEWKSGAFVRKS